jgi:hypothetical protein
MVKGKEYIIVLKHEKSTFITVYFFHLFPNIYYFIAEVKILDNSTLLINNVLSRHFQTKIIVEGRYFKANDTL